MTWLRWFLLGLVSGLGVLGAAWYLSAGSGTVAADFVQLFSTATVVRPNPTVFTVADVSIAGVAKPSIVAGQASRIAWDHAIPADGWLEVDLGMPDAAPVVAGGMLFRIGVSFDGRYEELVTTVLDPQANADDRRWRPITFDLSPYAGRTVSLIFNTAPNAAEVSGALPRAAWGAPRLVLR